MWELELIFVYFFLFMWGGKKCLYLVIKFILYIVGSFIFLLIGVLGISLYGLNELILNLELLGN